MREINNERDMGAMIYALQLSRQSLRWLIRTYPNDPEIAAHRAHLRKIEAALKGYE